MDESPSYETLLEQLRDNNLENKILAAKALGTLAY